MGLLQKIAWNTRKWNLQINILDVYLHDGDACWGFNLLQIRNNYICYCLLALEFRLPNGGNVKQFTIDNFDILFLGTFSRTWIEKINDERLWGHESSIIERIIYKVLSFLF